MNVQLTTNQEEYITNQVERGNFKNANDLIREAIQLHQTYCERQIAQLKTEIDRGRESGFSTRTIEEIALQKLHESKRK